MKKELLNEITSILSLLKDYKGKNNYIIYLKNQIILNPKSTLTEYQLNYIKNNINREPIYINQIIKISEWYGEKLKNEYNIDFTPKKLQLGFLIGETDTQYHIYVRWRKSEPIMKLIFLPKSAVLTDFISPKWEDKIIDFQKYEKISGITLKPHQERGVKFLTTREKAILSTQMGGGKTITAIVSALEGEFKKILIVCPASVKTTWQKELIKYVSEDEITIVEGSKWKENKFTIINYDILDNFYEIPTETVNRKIRNVDEYGNISYSTIKKEIISKKESVISKAMENSQLFQSDFDLIIIDEVHRLSNKSSIRYKIISDLIQRIKPKGVFELTGTMIVNNPMNLYNILKLIDSDITKDWVSYVKRYCDGKQIFVKGEKEKYTRPFLKRKGKSSWYDLSYNEKQELNNILDKYGKKIWLTNGASNLEELAERIKHLYLRETNFGNELPIKKETKILHYTLNEEEQKEYENAWENYINSKTELVENSDVIEQLVSNQKLIEGGVFRQMVADFMINRTIKLAEDEINKGNKVIIFCCFDKELYSLQEYFNERCVIYNGKMPIKQKDEAQRKFMEDDNYKVFIGNMESASVGLTLTSANVIIFNSVTFVPATNSQAEYRILRLGQTKDCYIYYQCFDNTYMERMFEILNIKNNIIDTVILDETKK